MNTQVSDQAWSDLARLLDVEQAALRAVAAVESSGSGFLSETLLRPKVLFEGHAFHRLTGGRFDQQAPNLSYPKWDKTKYAGSLAGEWNRLDAACQLDRAAALQSASWGAFQIMGFNYAYCGCNDVEAFVAQQYAGASEQMACFAHFIARPQYLAALRDHQWANFAKVYNGPGYAQNKYDLRLADAYARFVSGGSAGAAGRRKEKKKQTAAQPGRARFGRVPAERRRVRHTRNVRPDAVDLRDWEYRPSIAVAPSATLWRKSSRTVKQQGDTSACTGFALATVIESLIERARRPRESISGFMLYDMARRYDEWAGNDDEDSGSSLRGVLKGWSKHGASAAKLWATLQMPKPSNKPGADWWLDAVKRPMGAYYRISPKNVRDMHVALSEVGAICASALAHDGWDELLGAKRLALPKTSAALRSIKEVRATPDQGHAFAIVGYTQDGFIVQNSWGPTWGHGGFAVLTYADWLKNAMDCWVVQLGVVTVEHEAVAKAPSLRIDKTGKAVVSTNDTLGDHEISPFVIDMENDGKLSDRGRFRTNEDDLKALLTTHLPLARTRWKLAAAQPIDVAIYAHGGLTGEDAAAENARAWIPLLYSHQVFPIFLMWETGAVKTIVDIFEDTLRGEAEVAGGGWGRFRERLAEWKDERLEGLARGPGSQLWGEMKQNAAALSGNAKAGVVQLFKLFSDPKIRVGLPPVRLHLIGHSAGAIVHSYLGARALDEGLDVCSISLLAPAVRLDLFNRKLGARIAQNKIPMLIANLRDAAERADDTCRPYGHSLLYLVSRSFEDLQDTPLLGMQKYLVSALATEQWSLDVHQLLCPGGVWKSGSAATTATAHGGLDDDPAVRDAVVDFIQDLRADK